MCWKNFSFLFSLTLKSIRISKIWKMYRLQRSPKWQNKRRSNSRSQGLLKVARFFLVCVWYYSYTIGEKHFLKEHLRFFEIVFIFKVLLRSTYNQIHVVHFCKPWNNMKTKDIHCKLHFHKTLGYFVIKNVITKNISVGTSM